jgi:hypothetical protein
MFNLEGRRAGNVARMGEKRNAHMVVVGKPERKNHLEDQCVDGRIILQRIIKKCNGWRSRLD